MTWRPASPTPQALPDTARSTLPPQPGFTLVETDPPPRSGRDRNQLESSHVPASHATDYTSVIGTSSHSAGGGGDSDRGRELPARSDRARRTPRHQARGAGAASNWILTDARRQTRHRAWIPSARWPILLAHEVDFAFSPDLAPRSRASRAGARVSRFRRSDVREAARPLGRTVPSQHQADPAGHDHAAEDQPALHRVLHGRPQPRVRPRIAVARISDGPARQLLFASSGACAASSCRNRT